MDNLKLLADQRGFTMKKKPTPNNKYNFQCKQKKNFVHILSKISSFRVKLYTINLHIYVSRKHMTET